MNRVLFIHWGALGDFIMALRVAGVLRHTGARHITIAGRPHYAELGRMAGLVDEVMDLDTGPFYKLFSSDFSLSPDVQSRLTGFDLCVNMLADEGSPLSDRLREAGIPRVISIDVRPKPGDHRHITEQWLDTMRAEGFVVPETGPFIPITREARASARREMENLFNDPVERLILIHPGSGGANKRWPLDCYQKLALRLRYLDVETVFLSGPVEQYEFKSAEAATLRETAPLISDRALPDLAALLAGADLYIGNDSGVSHLAAAVGTPTIAIFRTTNPRVWRPRGSHVRTLNVDREDKALLEDVYLAAKDSLGLTLRADPPINLDNMSLPTFMHKSDSPATLPRLAIQQAKVTESRSILRVVLNELGLSEIQLESQVSNFLTIARRTKVRLDRAWWLLADDRPISACLCIESPGRTAVLQLANADRFRIPPPAIASWVRQILHAEATRNLRLIQVLLRNAEVSLAAPFESAGFRDLARLANMERTTLPHPPTRPVESGNPLEWVCYTPEQHQEFAELILATYEQSLDCPGLTGLREIDDIIEGHKSAGIFEPHRWLLVRRAGRAAACILMAGQPLRTSLEIVYLGVRPEDRGTGLARALVSEALRSAYVDGFPKVTLVLDRANTPAQMLYLSLGFHLTMMRRAMIHVFDSTSIES